MSDIADLRHRQIVWAGGYDAYDRVASDPARLAAVIEPAVQAWSRTGKVPGWAGPDLLRAWAFFLVRADRHGGGHSLAPGGSAEAQFSAVLAAVAAHRATDPRDAPPLA